MSFGSATAALADSTSASPVIVPLDVTMEDTGWLETVALARSNERHIAAPDAASPAAMQEGDAAPSDSRLAFLAVPPDFSITMPAVAASPGSNAIATAGSANLRSPATRSTGTNARDQAKSVKRTYKVNGAAIEFDIAVQLNGDLVGKMPLRIGSGRDVSVQLPELLALLRDRMDPQLHHWLSSAYSVNSHISFDQLRSAGFDVRYDAANDIVIMVTN